MGGKTAHPTYERKLFSSGRNMHFVLPPGITVSPPMSPHCFYSNKTTAKGVDHLCYKYKKCVQNRLYDPDLCSESLLWLEMIKENYSDAKQCGELWVKWNRSLVTIWKQDKVVLYKWPCYCHIVWADEDKFARWEKFLPVPKKKRCAENTRVTDITLTFCP